MVCRRCFAHRCLRQGDRLVRAAQHAAQADSRFAARFARRSRLRLSRHSLCRSMPTYWPSSMRLKELTNGLLDQ